VVGVVGDNSLDSASSSSFLCHSCARTEVFDFTLFRLTDSCCTFKNGTEKGSTVDLGHFSGGIAPAPVGLATFSFTTSFLPVLLEIVEFDFGGSFVSLVRRVREDDNPEAASSCAKGLCVSCFFRRLLDTFTLLLLLLPRSFAKPFFFVGFFARLLDLLSRTASLSLCFLANLAPIGVVLH